VTATGDILDVTEEANPDLMRALRGGGGNFGIAASLEYRLHPFETIYEADESIAAPKGRGPPGPGGFFPANQSFSGDRCSPQPRRTGKVLTSTRRFSQMHKSHV
jgi:hypothetical protein